MPIHYIEKKKPNVMLLGLTQRRQTRRVSWKKEIATQALQVTSTDDLNVNPQRRLLGAP